MRGSVVKKGPRWYVIIEQRDPTNGSFGSTGEPSTANTVTGE